MRTRGGDRVASGSHRAADLKDPSTLLIKALAQRLARPFACPALTVTRRKAEFAAPQEHGRRPPAGGRSGRHRSIIWMSSPDRYGAIPKRGTVRARAVHSGMRGLPWDQASRTRITRSIRRRTSASFFGRSHPSSGSSALTTAATASACPCRSPSPLSPSSIRIRQAGWSTTRPAASWRSIRPCAPAQAAAI